MPIFNVSYSPEFNPIESCFSQVKRYFCAERLNVLANFGVFDQNKTIRTAFMKVTPKLVASCVDKSLKMLKDFKWTFIFNSHILSILLFGLETSWWVVQFMLDVCDRTWLVHLIIKFFLDLFLINWGAEWLTLWLHNSTRLWRVYNPIWWCPLNLNLPSLSFLRNWFRTCLQ